MINTRFLRPANPSRATLWAIAGSAVGLMIALSPPLLSLMLLMGFAFAFLAFEEPTVALITMLIVAPLKTLIETESQLSLPLDIGQIAFAAALGYWALHRIRYGHKLSEHFRHPLLIPIGAFAFVTLLSLPSALALNTAITEWLKWIEMMLLVVIVADSKLIRWQWVLIGLLLAGGVQALIGLYEFRGGSGAPHLWILDYQYFRAFGTFGQPNPFGAFMGLLLPLALGSTWGALWAFFQERKAEDLVLVGVLGALSIALLMGLFISWSRGAWIGFAAASAVMLFFLPRRWWQGFVLVIGATVLFFIFLLLGLVPPQLLTRVSDFSENFTGFQDVRGVEINDENYAVIERLAHWQSALSMASDYPLTGVGFGNYEAAYPDYDLVNWPDALGHAHNYYLNLLAETGVLGLSTYAMMWCSIFWITWRTLSQTTAFKRGVVVGLMGVWTHVTVHSLVDKLYVNNLFLHIGVMFGLLAVLHHHAQFYEENLR